MTELPLVELPTMKALKANYPGMNENDLLWEQTGFDMGRIKARDFYQPVVDARDKEIERLKGMLLTPGELLHLDLGDCSICKSAEAKLKAQAAHLGEKK